MTRDIPRPAYGWSVHYCLHSAWISWLMSIDDEMRGKVFAHFGYGLDIARFTLAIYRHGWARVVTRVSDDMQDAWIGLELPVLMDQSDGTQRTEWQRAFELHHDILGLTPSLILRLGIHEMETQLDELIGAKS